MDNTQLFNKSNKKEKYIGKILFGAIQLSILFYPVFLICNLISWRSNDFVSFFVIAASSFVYGITLFSDTIGQAFLKWICSIPLTIALWYYFVEIHFYLRALNWVFPGYGKQSAGGSMATAFLLVVMVFLFFVTALTAILCSCIVRKSRKWHIVSLLQFSISTVACAGIVLTILIINQCMPSYSSIIYTG